MLCYEIAGGWVRPVGPRASTDGAFALRWQIDGDDHISDCQPDYGSPVCSADGNQHSRSLLSARDAPPLSRLDRDWQRRGFLRLDRRNSSRSVAQKGCHGKRGDFLPAFYRRFTGILEITTFRCNALENTRSYAPMLPILGIVSPDRWRSTLRWSMSPSATVNASTVSRASRRKRLSCSAIVSIRSMITGIGFLFSRSALASVWRMAPSSSALQNSADAVHRLCSSPATHRTSFPSGENTPISRLLSTTLSDGGLWRFKASSHAATGFAALGSSTRPARNARIVNSILNV